ncbi:uncharacterized protein LOC62_02G003391 [Vanrija pseudolonga]|uniref:Uncharacterized protein n=1 Tax=Vanrija pseudolonga TaxID=143232 RepID=A0AAF0Y406_9TREE|nr:hypothetical protein LOC62_02G003391 [Vanrija pseudolonga]
MAKSKRNHKSKKKAQRTSWTQSQANPDAQEQPAPLRSILKTSSSGDTAPPQASGSKSKKKRHVKWDKKHQYIPAPPTGDSGDDSGDDRGDESATAFRSTSTAVPVKLSDRVGSGRPLTLRDPPPVKLTEIPDDARAALNVRNLALRPDAKPLELGLKSLHDSGFEFLATDAGYEEMKYLYPAVPPSDVELADIVLHAPGSRQPPIIVGYRSYMDVLRAEAGSLPVSERREPLNGTAFGYAYVLRAEAEKLDFREVRYQFVVRRDASINAQLELHHQVLQHLLTEDDWVMFKGSLCTGELLPKSFKETWAQLLGEAFGKYQAEVWQDRSADKLKRGDLPSPAEHAAAKAELAARQLAERMAREWADKSIFVPFDVPWGAKGKKKEAQKGEDKAAEASTTSNHSSNGDTSRSAQARPGSASPDSLLSTSYAQFNRPDEDELLEAFFTCARTAAALNLPDPLPEGDERAVQAFEDGYITYQEELAAGSAAQGDLAIWGDFDPLTFFEFIELIDERMLSVPSHQTGSALNPIPAAAEEKTPPIPEATSETVLSNLGPVDQVLDSADTRDSEPPTDLTIIPDDVTGSKKTYDRVPAGVEDASGEVEKVNKVNTKASAIPTEMQAMSAIAGMKDGGSSVNVASVAPGEEANATEKVAESSVTAPPASSTLPHGQVRGYKNTHGRVTTAVPEGAEGEIEKVDSVASGSTNQMQAAPASVSQAPALHSAPSPSPLQLPPSVPVTGIGLPTYFDDYIHPVFKSVPKRSEPAPATTSRLQPLVDTQHKADGSSVGVPKSNPAHPSKPSQSTSAAALSTPPGNAPSNVIPPASAHLVNGITTPTETPGGLTPTQTRHEAPRSAVVAPKPRPAPLLKLTRSTSSAAVSTPPADAPSDPSAPASALFVNGITTPTETSGLLSPTQIRNARERESNETRKVAPTESAAQAEVTAGPSTPVTGFPNYTKGAKVQSIKSVLHSKPVERRKAQKILGDRQAKEKAWDEEYKKVHDEAIQLAGAKLSTFVQRIFKANGGQMPAQDVMREQMNLAFMEYNEHLNNFEKQKTCPVRRRLDRAGFVFEMQKGKFATKFRDHNK